MPVNCSAAMSMAMDLPPPAAPPYSASRPTSNRKCAWVAVGVNGQNGMVSSSSRARLRRSRSPRSRSPIGCLLVAGVVEVLVDDLGDGGVGLEHPQRLELGVLDPGVQRHRHLLAAGGVGPADAGLEVGHLEEVVDRLGVGVVAIDQGPQAAYHDL